MAITLTPRLGLPQWGAGTDPFGRAQMNDALAKIEANAALDVQGTRAARPAAGIRGRYYFATDTGLLYRDNGVSWDNAGAGIGGALPTASNPSDVGAEGVSNTSARTDHKHAREDHGPLQHEDYARLDGAAFTGTVTFTATSLMRLRRFSETSASPASGQATTTLDCANGSVHNVTLTANTTLALANVDSSATSATSVSVILKQDAIGGRTVTWPAGLKWPDGLVPALTTTANAVNVVTLLTPNGGATWYGYLAGRNMS